MSFVDRETFIALLEKLRSDDDAEIVAAAREISRHMDEGDVDWEDLLRKEGGSNDDDEIESDYEYDYDDDDDDDDAGAIEGFEATRSLITHIIEAYDISEATREDLDDYLTDLDDGDFTKSDKRYVEALHARLKAQQPGKDA